MTELCLDFSILKPKIKKTKWRKAVKRGAIKVRFEACICRKPMVARKAKHVEIDMKVAKVILCVSRKSGIKENSKVTSKDGRKSQTTNLHFASAV